MRHLTRVLLVLDSTCLIYFEQLGLTARLVSCGARLGVADAVRQEVGLVADGKSVRGLANSMVVQSTRADSAVLDESLGDGERESIAACRDDLRWRVLVTDDQRARRVAETLGVQTLDTRGLLWTLCVAGRISYAEFCDGVHKVGGRDNSVV